MSSAVYLDDPFGNNLAVISNFIDSPQGGGAALEYALNVGQIGVLRLTLPTNYDDLLLLDGRISVWRTVGARAPYRDGDACYLIRKWEYGEDSTTVTAVHVNHLLTRRIINYYANTTYTKKTATTADNLIKAFVNEQMLAGISGANRIGVETYADISAYLTKQADLSLGQSTSKTASWRNLFDVVRELCDTSTQLGTYLTAEIVATGQTGLELRTYTTQRGVDRRASSGQPLIFARDRGNVENVVLTVDRMNEVTFVTAGGGGEETTRATSHAIDTTRAGESPFNRIEDFTEDTNTTDTTTLTGIASAKVREGKPRISASGDLVETAYCSRGVHYDLGDYVTFEARGNQYDVRLDTIGVTISGGEQRTKAQFRVNQ